MDTSILITSISINQNSGTSFIDKKLFLIINIP